MRFFLEIIRIVVLLIVVGGFLGWVENNIYLSLGMNIDNSPYMWLISIANLLFLFVLYRNRWQFSGWYKGQQNRKLPKKATFLLLSFSCLLLVITPLL